MRYAELADAEELFALESASFPEDEMASLESIRLRLQQAARYFIVLEEQGHIIGFVNGTCVRSKDFEHDCMTTHITDGRYLVIHSVTIIPGRRRQKLGSSMFKEYIIMMMNEKSIDSILLLTKIHLIGMYRDCDFTLIRPSTIIHGKEMWYEMENDLILARQVDMFQVDAFTSKPWGGNPAAVVFLKGEHHHRSDDWMQKIAAENNLSETAFVIIKPETYCIRWFTPTKEVELCGHATLASAYALYETGMVDVSDTITFDTMYSGTLTASRNPISHEIILNFPLVTVVPTEFSDEEKCALLQGLNIQDSSDILYIGRSVYDILVEVNPEAMYALQQLDFGSLAKIITRGVVVTCLGPARTAGSSNPLGVNAKTDFMSRCFFPRYADSLFRVCSCTTIAHSLSRYGIDEDPVTGSAHCELAAYWSERLKVSDMLGYQASARGGYVGSQLCDDGRVQLTGHCVSVIKSKILI
jgi:predicted PhzF superfamily epimerase YddE/YHI9/N-acetylglutamate synthase-like GNAT family acetyltransferase